MTGAEQPGSLRRIIGVGVAVGFGVEACSAGLSCMPSFNALKPSPTLSSSGNYSTRKSAGQ